MTIRESDILSDLNAAMQLKPRRASGFFLFAIAAFVVAFFVWASLSRVEMLVRGQGQVVPGEAVQVVQSLEGGILKQLLVSEGDHVKKDQILLKISDVQSTSERGGAEAESYGLRAKRARLAAESNGTPFIMPPDIEKAAPKVAATEKALYLSRQQELQNAIAMLGQKITSAQSQIAETRAQISRLANSSALLSQELAITSKMVAQRAMPKIEELKQRRELADTNGQLNANRQKIPGLEADLKSAQRERQDQDDKFRSQALGELNDVLTKISKLNQNLKSIGDRVSRSELRSPVDGIINNIAVKTIGGVIQPAQPLVEIVPDDDKLKIIARIPPNDIAFLRVGQKVNVKISAYDSERYGALPGKLTRIGATSVSDKEGHVYFEIEVHTEKNYLGTAKTPYPITPGMVATVEVITGKRTILNYLITPLLHAKDKALTER